MIKPNNTETEAEWMARACADAGMKAAHPDEAKCKEHCAEMWKAHMSAGMSNETFIGNETRVDDKGWVQLVPYGDWPNGASVQRFRSEDATTIVNEFNRLNALPTRILGLPWYIGHPDHAAFSAKYPDNRAYGRIKKLEARPDGLYANVKFNAAGKLLVNEETFSGHSVNWAVRHESRNNATLVRPFSLKSVGFTNEPNIPVMPVLEANEKQNQGEVIMEKKKLTVLLKLADTATEEQIETAIVAHMANEAALATVKADVIAKDAKITELTLVANQATEVPILQGKVTTLTNEKTTLATEKLTLTNEKTQAETKFANERKARAKDAADRLIIAGKITAANRPAVELELVNEYDVAVKKYDTTKTVLHTESALGNLGNRNSAAIGGDAQRRDKIFSLVNEEQKKESYKNLSPDQAYSRAFKAVMDTHPELAVPQAA